MAYLEDILPQIRKGRKARRKPFSEVYIQFDKASDAICDFTKDGRWADVTELVSEDLLADDWELVPQPTRVADYLVQQEGVWIGSGFSSIRKPYAKETHPIGQQPEGSVMVPGSEREVTE
jgi:hypothetical protein